MPAPVRRAGRALLPDGRCVVWAVAEGGGGRRWRSAVARGEGELVEALTAETSPAGRLLRLELATGEGLLTLHADGDRVLLHGNVVRPTGVEHIALPWSDGHLLLAGASPVTAAIAAGGALGSVGVGEGASLPAVQVGPGLRPRSATWRVARLAERRWRLAAADGSAALLLETDPAGLPADPGGAVWPLELGAEGS